MTKEISKESLDITREKIKELKKIIPEVFTEDKIDFEKLQRTLGKVINGKDEKYSFDWAGRKETFKNIQTTAKGTLKPAVEESVNWDTTENLFIEGDNLEVLKLLQKAYFNKIKMIYIDPPYNTGNDFVYKDNYKNSIKSYLEQTGQSDEEGVRLTTNPETNGRFHSDWISMIYPRLFVARNLLREDGVIFVSIDDKEVHNLRKVMDEVYGEENFVGTIKRRAARKTAHLSKDMSDICDYIVIYAKGNLGHPLSIDSVKDNTRPVFNEGNQITEREIPEGIEARCKDGKYPKGYYKTRTIEFKLLDNLVIKNGKTDNVVKIKGPFRINQTILNETVYITRNFSLRRYLKDEEKDTAKAMSDLVDNKNYYNELGSEEIESLFGIKGLFNNPKPYQLIQYLIKSVHSSFEEDKEPMIVMDFFAGSGTTAQAIFEKGDENIKFVLVQLPEQLNKNKKEQKKAYEFLKSINKPTNLSELSKERIRRSIIKIRNQNKNKTIENKLYLGFKVFKLDKSNYKIWEENDEQDTNELMRQLEFFKSPLINDYKNIDVIYECIIKEGYNLNSKIEKTDVESNDVYKVTDGDLFFYISLDQVINTSTIDELKLKKENIFICLDEALNDSKKKNLSIQCNLKTV